jgi:hypothetical protein
LTLRENSIVEADLDGIYVTDGERLFFMTAEQDNMPLDPRENDCNYCTICYVRNRYLGSSKYDNDRDFADSDDLNDYLAGLNDRRAEFVSVPLYAYVHSGITISTGSFGDPWDSGCFGIAICTKEQVINAFGNDIDWQRHAKDIIEGEIETYDKFLTGGTYVYSTYLYHKETKSWTLEDTCGGFYSNDEDAMLSSYFNKNYRIINESEVEPYMRS